MKISEIRDAYYDATDKVSDIVRQLGLAGIAVIWIFRSGADSGGIKYSHSLIWPLGLFVLTLAADLLQYMYKSLLWGMLNWFLWRQYHDNEKDVIVSGKWNLPTLVLFWIKAALTMLAYVLLFRFIYRQF
jgi:hypothetical protein